MGMSNCTSVQGTGIKFWQVLHKEQIKGLGNFAAITNYQQALREHSISLLFSASRGCLYPWLMAPSSILKAHRSLLPSSLVIFRSPSISQDTCGLLQGPPRSSPPFQNLQSHLQSLLPCKVKTCRNRMSAYSLPKGS